MGPMTRRTSGWEVRLYEQIEAATGRPFAWGSHDCATWAFDVAASLTGQPSAADAWRGRYRTARGAERVMRGLGWPDRLAMGCALLGEPLPSPLLAQRGDLVLGPDTAFGVCAGARAAFIAPTGLIWLPLGACSHAWRI